MDKDLEEVDNENGVEMAKKGMGNGPKWLVKCGGQTLILEILS